MEHPMAATPAGPGPRPGAGPGPAPGARARSVRHAAAGLPAARGGAVRLRRAPGAGAAAGAPGRRCAAPPLPAGASAGGGALRPRALAARGAETRLRPDPGCAPAAHPTVALTGGGSSSDSHTPRNPPRRPRCAPQPASRTRRRASATPRPGPSRTSRTAAASPRSWRSAPAPSSGSSRRSPMARAPAPSPREHPPPLPSSEPRTKRTPQRSLLLPAAFGRCINVVFLASDILFASQRNRAAPHDWRTDPPVRHRPPPARRPAPPRRPSASSAPSRRPCPACPRLLPWPRAGGGAGRGAPEHALVRIRPRVRGPAARPRGGAAAEHDRLLAGQGAP